MIMCNVYHLYFLHHIFIYGYAMYALSLSFFIHQMNIHKNITTNMQFQCLSVSLLINYVCTLNSYSLMYYFDENQIVLALLIFLLCLISHIHKEIFVFSNSQRDSLPICFKFSDHHPKIIHQNEQSL
jgi:hypothetical protein